MGHFRAERKHYRDARRGKIAERGISRLARRADFDTMGAPQRETPVGLFDDIEEEPAAPRTDPAALRRMNLWASDLMRDFAAAPHRPAVDRCAARFGTKRKWLVEHQPALAKELIDALAAAHERVKNIPIPSREEYP